MSRYLFHVAYGWLALSGLLHFVADVVSQYVRGKRAPSLETSLYYGLNSAFSLGQVVFGLLGLYLASRAMEVLAATPIMVLSALAAMGWLAITLLFMEYWEPKANAGLFCALLLAACVPRLLSGT